MPNTGHTIVNCRKLQKTETTSTCAYCKRKGHTIVNCNTLKNIESKLEKFYNFCKSTTHSLEECLRKPSYEQTNFWKLINSFRNEWTRGINGNPLKINMDIKTGALNDNKPRKINYNKGNEKEDTNPNLLTSKRRSIFIETSDNIENKIEENLNRIDSNEPEIDNTASNKREEEDIATKVTMYFLNLENSLQYVEMKNPYTNEICKLLVDSGAQLNIIKRNQIPPYVILENKKIQLSGITDKVIETLEVVKTQINELYIDFHVTPEEFSLPYDGILGIKILTE